LSGVNTGYVSLNTDLLALNAIVSSSPVSACVAIEGALALNSLKSAWDGTGSEELACPEKSASSSVFPCARFGQTKSHDFTKWVREISHKVGARW
jgi:hypothetical protein